jgi:proteasome lid subunit RPN8/RPN11
MSTLATAPSAIHLPAARLAEIAAHLEAAYPHEGCGILIGRLENGYKMVTEVVLTGNAREEGARHNRYSIPPEELLQGELQAEELGLEVVGYFHSHPDHPDRPSEFDRENGWPGYTYLITAVKRGQATSTRAWQLRQDRSAFDPERLVILGEDDD